MLFTSLPIFGLGFLFLHICPSCTEMSPTERDAPRAEKDLRSLMKRSPEWSCRVFPDICDRQVDGER